MNQACLNPDVIVVGSGPGGATVARESVKLGKKVLILEWGPNPVLSNSFSQFFKYLLRPGKSLLISNGFLGMVRGILTGGSSTFYYGTCFDVPQEMFAAYGIDLRAEVQETLAELPIAPLREEMMTPMANRLMESAQDLGYQWNKLNKFMFQDRWRPEYPFGYYGDANQVKWTARNYIEDAVSRGASLVNQAKVTKVIIEDGVAVGVEFIDSSRRAQVVKADKVVLAAGGIGSAVILRKSGIKESGYDFFFDPLISVCGTVKDLQAGNEIPMSGGIHFPEDGYVMTDMSLPPLMHLLFSAEVLRLGHLFDQSRTLRIMVKIKDGLGGKITNRGGIRKKLSPQDKEKLKSGYGRAKEILINAGAKNIYKTWYFAAHPGGTVKIGDLVDSDLQTSYKNLYVCDCSVIPKPWGLPPTLSIICLGKRLAKHLYSN